MIPILETAQKFPAPNGKKLLSSQIAGLQVLRAVAAFSVLLCHALYFSFPCFQDFTSLPGTLDLFLAAFGVTLFFVISGFLMASLAVKMPAAKFITHRVLRIYPLYWIVVAVVTGLHFLAHSPIFSDFAALALSPGPGRPFVLLIQWTLQFEIMFYLVVTAIIVAGLAGRIAATALIWLLAIFMARLLMPDWHTDQPSLGLMIFSSRCFPFALGLLIPSFQSRWKVGPALIALASSAIALAVFSRHDFSFPMGFGCAVLVAWVVSLEPPGSAPKKNPMTLMGDWSYGLYLIHAPIVVAVTGTATLPTFSFLIALALPLALCCPVGIFDVWLHKRLKLAADSWPGLSLAASTIIITAYLLL